METNFAKIRQRLVGSLVLLLVIVLIVLLLLFASKHGSNKTADDQAAARDLSAQPDTALVELPATGAVAGNANNDSANTTNSSVTVAVAPPASVVASPVATMPTSVSVDHSNPATSNVPSANGAPGVVGSVASPGTPVAATAQPAAVALVATTAPAATAPTANVTTNAEPDLEVTTDQFGQVELDKEAPTKASVTPSSVKKTTTSAHAKIHAAKTAVTAHHNTKVAAKAVAKPATKPATKATTKTATAVSGWVVKLGSFASPLHAASLSKELRTKGYKAHTELQSTSKGVLTQVFVGPEVTKEAAQKLATKIAISCKMKGQVVKK